MAFLNKIAALLDKLFGQAQPVPVPVRVRVNNR